MLYIYLALGGFCGTVSRYFLGSLLNHLLPGAFPLGTWLVNLTGCLAMGFILTYSLERLVISPELRLGLTTGMMGAYTTFSTFNLETVHLFLNGRVGVALLYLFVSLAGGLVAMKAGTFLGRFPLPGINFCSKIKERNEDV